MKTAAKPPQLVPQKHGGKLFTRGVPGNKGGGRPPKEWTSFCKAAIEHPGVQEAMMEVMQTPHARGQVAAVALAASYAVGKPVERVQHSGSGERVLRIVREPLPPLPDRRSVPVATVQIVKAES